jgi:hypothetical protein
MGKYKVVFTVIFLMSLLGGPAEAGDKTESIKDIQKAVSAHLSQVINAEMEYLNSLNCLVEDKKCLAEEIQERYRLDQLIRADFEHLSLCGAYAETHQDLCRSLFMGSIVFQIDLPNTKRLKEIISVHGFPSAPVFNKETQIAAWFIVQHAQFIGLSGSPIWDVDLAESIMPNVKKAVSEGSLTPWHYAAMYDRIALNRGKSQRYATQYQCDAGKALFRNLEDQNRVTEFRKKIGMKAFDQTAYDSQCRGTS